MVYCDTYTLYNNMFFFRCDQSYKIICYILQLYEKTQDKINFSGGYTAKNSACIQKILKQSLRALI